ncbi:MAG: EscU/YscU/HrcU family type III secretion system export apparatus switch protein [Deltaproteobacteria bacterium]|nr:EscU/YscU/HrcU family type III secretion system export apparatus switch protein [Deltaproteobacteria bacterium]
MEEKNHPATDRQRERFAERGQLAISRELNGAGAIVGACVGLALFGATAARTLATFLAGAIDGLPAPSLGGVGRRFLLAFGQAALPVLAGAALGAVGLGVIQTRGRTSGKATELDLSRLDPVARLQQMFASTEGLVSLASALVKVVLVIAVCGATLAQGLPPVLQRGHGSLKALGQDGGGLLVTLGWRAALTLLVLGGADWAVTWLRLERQMRMSNQEVRDDQKEDNGDPLIRAQRRRRQRELLRQRSLKDVERATAVLVNPSHFAVAILYRAQKMSAPKVVAKGTAFAAERIRALARRAGVPVVANPPLTRMLYRRVKVGREIPSDLYQAVAAVLAYVFRLRQGVL